MKYHVWTMGCQMNKAESSRLAGYLASLGLENVKDIKDADILILNTCVVRQNAEDKVNGMLGYLKGIKQAKPEMRIAVTGCFVTDDLSALSKSFPYVNHFFKPGESRSFEEWLLSESVGNLHGNIGMALQSVSSLSVYIPIIQGCNNFCSYCIVPYRRGREQSRTAEDVVTEAQKAAVAGAREIILLGQNVNSYGKDLGNGTDLSGLLALLNQLEGLLRIRFLTNHPRDMSPDLISSIASLDKVCHHFCVPLQAGDDLILKAMHRHYTYQDFRALIRQTRQMIPDIALSTDIIVGFPGESEDQFENTFKAIEELRFDAVHIAAYSTRTQTYASEHYPDDVPYEVKIQRLRRVENLQKGILTEINRQLIGKTLEILVEGKKGSKWYGRTYSDKVVFFTGSQDYSGKLVSILIESASPWSLQGIPATV
ncbi:MAG: tRNA (N6-isopentenyl adenosine(37)-C2)-methylthiotransferase MiaB [Dehalococcoidia bacterium]|jgi:tRNA-2-methylthio-N6-dimethylallyladenosine synthase